MSETIKRILDAVTDKVLSYRPVTEKEIEMAAMNPTTCPNCGGRAHWNTDDGVTYCDEPNPAQGGGMSDNCARDHAYGIRGPYGNIWTPETFPTPEAAAEHCRKFWGNDQKALRGFHVVCVEIRIKDVSCADLPPIPIAQEHAA